MRSKAKAGLSARFYLWVVPQLPGDRQGRHCRGNDSNCSQSTKYEERPELCHLGTSRFVSGHYWRPVSM
jgi:hypothetical protein